MKTILSACAICLVVLSTAAFTSTGDFANEAGDDLLRLALESAPGSLCAACECCNPSCSSRGGAALTPFGQIEPSYCGHGCDIKDECLWLTSAGDPTDVSEVFAHAWASAVRSDSQQLMLLTDRYSQHVVFNADRGALQLHGCDGSVIAHYPLAQAAVVRLAELL
jgi:hypothetical protein